MAKADETALASCSVRLLKPGQADDARPPTAHAHAHAHASAPSTRSHGRDGSDASSLYSSHGQQQQQQQQRLGIFQAYQAYQRHQQPEEQAGCSFGCGADSGSRHQSGIVSMGKKEEGGKGGEEEEGEEEEGATFTRAPSLLPLPLAGRLSSAKDARLSEFYEAYYDRNSQIGRSFPQATVVHHQPGAAF